MPRHSGVAEAPETTPAIEWAGALLVNARGELPLNLRDSSKALFPGLWDLIGGTLEAAETPEACILREITEETGAVVDSIEFLHAYDVALDDGKSGRLHVFLGKLDVPASELLVGEGVEHRFFAPTALDGIDIVPGTRLLLREFVTSDVYPRMSASAGTGDRPHPNPLPEGERIRPLAAGNAGITAACDSPSPPAGRGLVGGVSSRPRP
jgi:8-oxo-dGTP pyrophosphatase MutT (NUDIX family)